jgi:hypothetical protein
METLVQSVADAHQQIGITGIFGPPFIIGPALGSELPARMLPM